MKDSKNIVIGLLCAVVCIMAVAYAAFSTTLNINGTASIASNWDVHISDIQCTAQEVEGGEAAAVTKSVSGTTATFGFTFNQPGDTGQCVVTVTNGGDLNAIVDSIVETDSDDTPNTLNDGSIQYSVSGIDVGTLLPASGTNTYTIDASFVDVSDGAEPDADEKEKTLTVTIEYVQNLSS